jgi:hypothetical protein
MQMHGPNLKVTFFCFFVDILCEIFSNLYDKMNDFRL